MSGQGEGCHVPQGVTYGLVLLEHRVTVLWGWLCAHLGSCEEVAVPGLTYGDFVEVCLLVTVLPENTTPMCCFLLLKTLLQWHLYGTPRGMHCWALCS